VAVKLRSTRSGAVAVDGLRRPYLQRRLIHHSDRGVQYLVIRYAQRLADAGAVASVGSRGDSYDNAMAEAFNSLFRAELVRDKGPWTTIDDLEIAVAAYNDWFNHRRLHGEIGPDPTRRIRGQPPPSQPRPGTRRSVSREPPLNPARDIRPRHHLKSRPSAVSRWPGAAAPPHRVAEPSFAALPGDEAVGRPR
jgi:putative transposase